MKRKRNYTTGNGSTSNRSGDQITLLAFQAINANGTITFITDFNVPNNDQFNFIAIDTD